MLAVPNCSEGRDPEVVDALAEACRVPGARVLDRHSDPDHDRTVLTIAGDPMGVQDALFALAEACLQHIDLRWKRGAHPRVGALDVAPLVAMGPDDEVIAAEVAHGLAERIGWGLGIPVFLYGAVATDPERVRPHHFRAGGIDALGEALDRGEIRPDAGPPRLHPTAGCVLVGVRDPLVAWNVWLPDASVAEARAIADRVRESGGGLPGVRAMGWYLPEAGVTQLSMNIEQPDRYPPWRVMDAVRREADRLGVRLGDSELVGLVSRRFIGGPSPAMLGLQRFTAADVLEAQCPAFRDPTRGD
ncbi:MAG: glutamate formiminotransferase [Thermoleophilia bacterium]|nr:glutamate formiminotransferase [Thermoleophilia bacterium]